MPWNGYAFLVLLVVVGLYVLDAVADLLNVRAIDSELPEGFEDVYDRNEYLRSQQYARINTWVGLTESTLWLIAFLLFWRLGGFVWVDGVARSVADHPVVAGYVFFGILAAISFAFRLPMSVVDTFVIEERFGFNRTTVRTFVMDQIKALILTVVIGGILMGGTLWLFERVDHAWILVWILFTSVSLVLSYLGPRVLLPLFFRFRPLPDGELKDKIDELARKCHFPVAEILVMDGSQRSTKSNAFFTGFGKNKRIALYDTLIENHSTEQLVSILAHEIAHYKKRHILQHMVLGIAQVGLLSYLLGRVLHHEGLAAAFGLERTSVYTSIAFFLILVRPLNRVLGILSNMLSRRNEYQADRYAAEVVGDAAPMIAALKKLSKDNLVNLTPHPFEVFLYYSHPPVRERVEALLRWQARQTAAVS